MARLYTFPLLNRLRGRGRPPILFRAPSLNLGSCLNTCADGFMYLLGPLLIILALAIIFGLTWSFFTILLPMLVASHGGSAFCAAGVFHVSLVVFFLINIIWNYYLCVTTSNKGERYERVVRELADATGFVYPETDEEVAAAKRDYEQKVLERARRRRVVRQDTPTPETAVPPLMPPAPSLGSNEGENGVNDAAEGSGGSTVTVRQVAAVNARRREEGGGAPAGSTEAPQRIYGWMLMGPQEWAFCAYSNKPKPPRSHYDHVTNTLVLNMDHYCPWMFNTVGYFNYRYFCNFLLFVFLGMFYGTIITLKPFMEMNGPLYRQQIRASRTSGLKIVQHLESNPFVPTPSEKTPVAFSFMLCLSVGLAVFFLLCFHAYLVLTAQTTVEFHGNCANKRRAKKRGTSWINPYDLGWEGNWKQVYGSKHPFLAVMPSSREPDFLPIPINGELVRRHPKANEDQGVNITRIRAQRSSAEVIV